MRKIPWRKTYQLNDVDTVRGTSVKDFGDSANCCMAALYLLTEFPQDTGRNRLAREAKKNYRECQKAYDRRERLFSTFELDSEYFPVVIIRSLLPHLGHYLKSGDYKNAYMISTWIYYDVCCWRDLMLDFSRKMRKDPREFHRPA
jgi:hypothetical protein